MVNFVACGGSGTNGPDAGVAHGRSEAVNVNGAGPHCCIGGPEYAGMPDGCLEDPALHPASTRPEQEPVRRRPLRGALRGAPTNDHICGRRITGPGGNSHRTEHSHHTSLDNGLLMDAQLDGRYLVGWIRVMPTSLTSSVGTHPRTNLMPCVSVLTAHTASAFSASLPAWSQAGLHSG